MSSKPQTAEWDAVVVGAGPAGATTAALLARAGRRTALIDAAHFPRHKVCGEFLSAEAWRLLDEMRLGVSRDMSVPLTRFALSTPRQYVEMQFREPPSLRPATLSRHWFDAALVDAAKREGAEFVPGYRIRRVIVTDGRAAGIDAVDVGHPSRELQLSARVIVAADGRHSRVVQDTGRLQVKSSGLIGFKSHVRPDSSAPPRGDAITMHALPGGYVGVCPTGPGEVNVCGVFPKARLKDAHARLPAALRAWTADNPAVSPLFAAHDAEDDAWLAMPDVSPQWAVPNVSGVLYVGDATGTIEPLAGQGMTMALASAKLAAEYLLNSREPAADENLQRAYHRAWHARFDHTIAAAGWFGAIMRRPKLLAAMIAVGGAVPSIGNWIMQTVFRKASVAG